MMMTAIRTVSLILALTITAPSFAKPVSCEDAYAAASRKYLDMVEKAAKGAEHAGILAGGAGVAYVTCVGFTLQFLGCGAAVGGLAFVYWLNSHVDTDELAWLEQLHKIHLLNQQYKSGTVKGSEEVQEFVQTLGVDIQREEEAVGEVARRLGSGSLCRRGRPAVTYDELIRQMQAERAAGS